MWKWGLMVGSTAKSDWLELLKRRPNPLQSGTSLPFPFLVESEVDIHYGKEICY